MIKKLVIVLFIFTFNVHAKDLANSVDVIWISDTLSAGTERSNDMDVDGDTMALIFPLISSHYNVIEQQGNFSRSLSLLKSKPNVCTGNKLITSDRKKYSYITNIPQVVFPGLRLYIDQNSNFYSQVQALANHDNTLSIANILTSIPNILFGVAGGRKYGKEIDSLIDKPKWQSRFLQRNASDMAAGVIKMFEHGRLDLIIEYPNVLSHYQSQDKQSTELQSYSIAESQQYMLGYIMCSKSDLGLQLINDFNQAIEKVSKDKRYFDTHVKWFDASTKSDAIKFYNTVFNTNFH